MTWRQVVPAWLVLLIGAPLVVLCVLEAVRAGARAGASWWRRAALVVLVGVVALTPATLVTQQVAGSGPSVELYVVVDRTGSMAAQDWGPGPELPRPPGTQDVPTTRRLDGARIDAVSLADDVPGAGYSVIGFASEASTELPLTTDGDAVAAWAATVTQEVTASSTGSSLATPVAVLERVLTTARERSPHASRYVFVLSDGEETDGPTDGQSTGDWSTVAGLVDGGAVLGYGTPEGATMTAFDGTDDPGAPLIEDPATGGPAVSRIDETALRSVADALGVPYVHRTGVEPTQDLLAGLVAGTTVPDEVTTTHDVVWPFALAAAVLLAGEALGWARAVRRPAWWAARWWPARWSPARWWPRRGRRP
ncbi:VWA domain-containing protein [Cellulomonas sp. DKR-3]|uniref:VWA domain-containing protein n=1 Tax=Cellulomonas fulva TaxID=2835530 RepID=A0ABS5TXE4_9CELL|nr:vWA domain-containing protein [Cellulomonas fulva]MBT0993825.1 VWA domain-containing protein [Cellulomonas fulva]